MEEKESLSLALQQQIKKAMEYIDRSVALEAKEIEGATKLTRKLQAELKFLNRLNKGSIPVKPCHLNSTNLSHLGALLDVAEKVNTVAILKPVAWHTNEKPDTLLTIVIDVVTLQKWIKVIARNPIALHRSWEGEGNFGDKSIDKQAKEYISASQQHEVNYSIPRVMFVFTQGITEMLAECVHDLGIIVKGDIIPNPNCDSLTNPKILSDKILRDASCSQPAECSKVNMDVTAMIALVSGLTNGSCLYKFQEQVLTEQAEQERKNPLLPKLKPFLEGKKLYACSSAISSFKSIVDTLGGPNERHRARDLLSKITEVSNQPSTRANNLSPSGRIKPRPRIVFGTGDTLQAATVSSNGAFVRAAKEQGVEFSVFIHEPRALTESKEAFATAIKED